MSGPETHINHSEKQSNNPLENTHSKEGELQKEKVEVWKQRAYAVGTTKGGETVVFDRPSTTDASRPNWNPEVRPGQTLSGVPQILKDIADKPFTNQLVALKDAAMMGRIKSLIAKTYGEGIDKDITHLTPREAMDLARKILAERTQYDKYSTSAFTQPEKKGGILKDRNDMSIEEYMRLKLARRPTVDRRDVESILKDPNDLDVICRNQSEAFIVIFEAIKQIQDPEVSLLQTSFARLVGGKNTLPLEVGRMPDGRRVQRLEGEKGLFAISGKIIEKQQESIGEHVFSTGSIHRLSAMEEKQIQYVTNNALFINPTQNAGHGLVECITQDRKGRFHVIPVNTSDESAKAEATGSLFLNETILSWGKDFSRNELRRVYDQVLQSADAETARMITANYPLLMAHDAQESKRHLTPEEVQWCKNQVNTIRERVSSKWNYTTVYDQLFIINTVAAFIDDGSLDDAESILQIGKETEWQWKRGMKDLTAFGREYDHLQKVINQQRTK